MRPLRHSLAALLALACAPAAWAWEEDDVFSEMEAPEVAEDALSDMRGGMIFTIDGMEIRIALGLETLINGTPVLISQLGIEDLLGADGSLRTGPRIDSFGDPLSTHVIHQVGVADLNAVITNRIDGLDIQSNGRMDIQIPNFSDHLISIRSELAARGVHHAIDDASMQSLSR